MAVNVPQIDFTPLGQLGQVYQKAKMEGSRQSFLSRLGKDAGYDEVSRGLLGIGDLEGGKTFAALAAAQRKTNEPTSRMQELASAGIQPGTPEYRDAILASGRGATVNVNNAGETAFAKSMGDEAGKRWNRYIGEGDKAQRALVDVGSMREISQRLGSQGAGAWVKEAVGPYAEAMGVQIDGLDDIQAFSSIIERLAPQQRVEGSGATSDIEYKGFLRSLPALSQHPQAREAILDSVEAMQRYSISQGEIATQLANGEISRPDAERAVRALGDPMQRFNEFKKANPDLYRDALKTDWQRRGERRKAGAQTQPGQPMAQPGQPAAPGPQPQVSPSQLMDFAREAIKGGAPRERIIEELRSRGIDPAGL